MTREGRTVQPPLLSSSSSSPHLMDAVFQLDNNGRQSFLQFLMQSSGAAYTCLWSYLAPASCLCSIDGYYQEQSGNPSSSSGSLARRLFEEYKKSLIIMENNHGHIPGFAYWSNNPYFETREDELWKMATNNTQRQFYQEARIKLVVFMGCVNGEIELGFSNMLQMQMRNLFPEDFSRQNPRSSSSSSMDSPEYSSLLFNLPAVGFVTEAMKEAPINPTIQNSGQLQVLQALSLASNLQFPTPGSEHDVMAKAFLAVISSPSSSSSSSQQMQNPRANPRVSAFGPYFPTSLSTPPKMANIRKRQNPMNRAIAYFRGLHLARPRDRQPLLRVANTQLHHMMSERKRREKLNDSFLALKALLPSGTKKDKASILTTTREYLTSLRNRIDELREINAALEARLSASKAIVYDSLSETISDNRFDVRIRHIEESTSSTEDHRVIELQVIVRGECPSLQLTIFILEFVKKLENVQMMGVDSGTRASGSGIVNRVNLRLRIEGNEWDESAFEEAVKRIVADVAR